MGRVEHVAELGNLVTDFTLDPGRGAAPRERRLPDRRRPPAAAPAARLGRAEAGAALEGRSGSSRSAQALSLSATASLEPEPIPLDVKVVLLGERSLYYLLSQLDPEFPELFKVAADFEEEIERTPEGERLYARLLATFARPRGAAPARPRRGGARRRAGLAPGGRRASGCRFTRETVGGPAARGRPPRRRGGRGAWWPPRTCRRRSTRRCAAPSRVRERDPGGDPPRHAAHRHARRGGRTGERARRCCSSAATPSAGPAGSRRAARLGSGNVVDIEKEVALGGPIHSKGVLILAGFLGQRFASERPLSLAASLVFEQSYSRRRGRQRLVRRSWWRCSRPWPRCRSGRGARSPAR